MISLITQPAVHAIGQAKPSHEASDGTVRGALAVILRLEGLVVLMAAALAYWQTGGGWTQFAVLFLLPDISMAAYLAGPRVGAAVYNSGHTYLAPAALGLAGYAVGLPALFEPALIWAAHIGFDRAMGYGLKYSAAFGATHLGWRGKRNGNRS